eukprot:TRINITY_DN7341_c0_g1_i1.p1 TRINITY_DN7341_c0_g1~~TRINITY_DN7341_c0_g1_i1.p1  ORF type:complete len:211 (+),score=45.50 TRINITY_DN7341_c0_g1_i1:46-633(+)
MEGKKDLKIVCLSDTHNHHREIDIPKCDLLLHSGDFTSFGRQAHLDDFDRWLGDVPCTNKVVCPGNHENVLKSIELKNANYVSQQLVQIDGWNIFGTKFLWPNESNPKYDDIPNKTNILITHGPPQGIMDGGKGCPALTRRIKNLKLLKLVVFGHIHDQHGMIEKDGVIYVNAAMCREKDLAGHPPIVIDLKWSM